MDNRARVFSDQDFSAATKLDMKERYNLVGTKQSLLVDAEMTSEYEDVEKKFTSRVSKEPTNIECHRRALSNRYAKVVEEKDALREREKTKKYRQGARTEHRDRKFSGESWS